jgi:hypothetical protein
MAEGNVVTNKKFILELSEREAALVCCLVGVCDGDDAYSIYLALLRLGVDYNWGKWFCSSEPGVFNTVGSGSSRRDGAAHE